MRRVEAARATYDEAFTNETLDGLAVTLVAGALIEAVLSI